MYLQVGQVLPLSSLAKGMLTVSGNDAANSAAITLGGSVDGFVDLMNKKLNKLECWIHILKLLQALIREIIIQLLTTWHYWELMHLKTGLF